MVITVRNWIGEPMKDYICKTRDELAKAMADAATWLEVEDRISIEEYLGE